MHRVATVAIDYVSTEPSCTEMEESVGDDLKVGVGQKERENLFLTSARRAILLIMECRVAIRWQSKTVS